jgi:hypothetical protein
VPVNITPSDGRSYPLSLYLDVVSLRRLARSWVSFDDWSYCSFIDEATGRDELTDLRRARGLVHAELTYCVSAGDGPLALAGKREPSCVPAVGPYRFKTVWYPADLLALRRAGNTTREHMATGYLPLLRADGRRDMFLTNAWRGFWRRYGSFSARSAPGFNPIHVTAVRAWLAHRLDVGGALDGAASGGGSRAMAAAKKGGKQAAAAAKKAAAAAAAAASKLWPLGSYALFQWRSETVGKELVEPCARALASKVKASLAALRRVTRAGGVLAADLPAPNNPCMMWKEFHASNRANASSAPRRAVRKLLAAGMVKYDKDHPALDAGVLSIRDWLLATRAAWYVTCHAGGDKAAAAECRGCFRADSKYVARIVEERAARGRASVTNWFRVTPELVRVGGGGRGRAAKKGKR